MAKRTTFQDLPVGRKILSIAVTAAVLILGSMSLFSLGKEFLDWRGKIASELQSHAQIIGAEVAPMLKAGDTGAARKALSALDSEANIRFAIIYGKDGKLFVSYRPSMDDPAHISGGRPADETLEFRGAEASITKPVVLGRETVGWIHMATEPTAYYGDLLSDAVVDLLVLLAAVALTIVSVRRLQSVIVAPLEALTEVALKVSRTGDYTVRAPPKGADEFGVLARSFNDMLQAVQERDAKLAQHQSQLEETVQRRTGQLNLANIRLERELIERKAAQAALRAHDSMLKTVAHGAAVLLGAPNLDDAISVVLELVGQTLAVGRIQVCPITTGPDGRLRSSVRQEWFAPGRVRLGDDPLLNGLDLTALLPGLAAAGLVGDRTALSIDEMPESIRAPFENAGARSILFTPIMIDGKLWGGLWFMDSGSETRDWSWAETDSLATLAGLIGVSIARARYVKELADANAIVQNSPTVLYRLKGDPKLSLTYISHNVTKFGYDPKTLVDKDSFIQTLVHPDDRAKLTKAMAAMVSKNAVGAAIEFRLVLPEGGFRWVENRYTPVRDKAGRLVEIEGIIIDITERKAAEDKIALLARTDSLTGLANRATFVERLHQAFAGAKRGGNPFAVLYLDLDHFKNINDTRGHPVGDLLLKETAERLKTRVRDTDLVARLGGDEFAILQMEISDPADAGALGGDIVKALAAPYKIDNAELHVTASVGIAPYTETSAGPDVMLSQADLALYRAKDDGRDQYRFHTEDLDRQVSERVTITADLRQAIERQEFRLDYQPQVELQSGRIVGMEALVRWQHPTRGLLQPADFLAVAETAGVMNELGSWVLDGACAQMRRWRDQGLAPKAIAVNVSRQQLKGGSDFVREVASALKRHGLKAADLELDVTESMLAMITLSKSDVLDRLADLGVRLALDDFGTEYSSFDYLRSYHIDHLKVARQFIENATRDAGHAATVRAIIGTARELGINVIAEGVETQDQRTLLLSIGQATQGQGFFFSEPVDPARATELLREWVVERPKAPGARHREAAAVS